MMFDRVQQYSQAGVQYHHLSRVRLRNFMEMEPDPENRVTLGTQTDPYGQPMPLVRHECTEADRRSLGQVSGSSLGGTDRAMSGSNLGACPSLVATMSVGSSVAGTD